MIKSTYGKIVVILLSVMISTLSFFSAACTEPPIAQISSDKDYVTTKDTVTFYDNSSGEIVSRIWNFGDGETSSEQNPTHTFKNKGNYTVTYVAENKGGQSSAVLNVDVIAAPVADFEVEKLLYCTGENIQFNNKSSGDITSLSWDFGDQTSSIDENPIHDYYYNSVFDVTLNVSNELASDSKTIQIETLRPVRADFSITEDSIRHSGKPIQFIDESKEIVDSWYWDFGDGTTSTEQNPIHVFEEQGIYDVTLTASNEVSSDTYSFKNGGLTISNLEITTQICSSVTGLDEYTIRPDAIFSSKEKVYIYIEVTGYKEIKTNQLYESWVRIPSIIFRSPDGQTQVITLNFEGHMYSTEPNGRMFFTIWLSNFESGSGQYQIMTLVTDVLFNENRNTIVTSTFTIK